MEKMLELPLVELCVRIGRTSAGTPSYKVVYQVSELVRLANRLRAVYERLDTPIKGDLKRRARLEQRLVDLAAPFDMQVKFTPDDLPLAVRVTHYGETYVV